MSTMIRKWRSSLVATIGVAGAALIYVAGGRLVPFIVLAVTTILYAIECDIQRAKSDTIPIIEL